MSRSNLGAGPLQPGVNVDPVDVTAGMQQASALGYTDTDELAVIEYALRRWQRGEEDGAEATIRSHGIDYTSWRVILAAAVAAASQPPTLADLEKEAEQLARHVATDRLPPDAGAIAKLLAVVRQAHALGRSEAEASQAAEAASGLWSLISAIGQIGPAGDQELYDVLTRWLAGHGVDVFAPIS